MVYYKSLKYALRRQRGHGGTIWYNETVGMYYILGDIE